MIDKMQRMSRGSRYLSPSSPAPVAQVTTSGALDLDNGTVPKVPWAAAQVDQGED